MMASHLKRYPCPGMGQPTAGPDPDHPGRGLCPVCGKSTMIARLTGITGYHTSEHSQLRDNPALRTLVEKDIAQAYIWHLWVHDHVHNTDHISLRQEEDRQYMNAVLAFGYGRIGRSRMAQIATLIERSQIATLIERDLIRTDEPPKYTWQQLLLDHPEPR